ncbi:cupin-like domain-containing protein [Chitinophaga rhizophila]|uniref:Cupin-like domain-containing protein n=1 Tax=Chitinophaga rhizophila TaxID=2866212 RepID=A0ABS7GDG5_9BACT|nr:cupin-like domain-containing protein [Chitinophaga rhizophila]MBW8685719.1 cupin-like domain-containing protein [Chitinophaga rhizophila]
MHLKPVKAISGYNREQFAAEYLETGIPVLIKDFIDPDCEALKKWDYDYFRQQAGDVMVEVHSEENAHLDKATSQPAEKMKFGDYLNLIESQPTVRRLFLFNLLRERPDIKKELAVRKIADNLLTWLPFLFFGGEGSSVRYHYDIDMSHVFLSQFQGVKKVWLFPNEQSDLLYRLPWNFHGIADLRNPDYAAFPALSQLDGWECTLHFGETLFIPSGYWHYIQYETAGYSVAYRALPVSMLKRAVGVRNIFITRRFDDAMRKILGRKWFDYKMKTAHRRAERAVGRIL